MQRQGRRWLMRSVLLKLLLSVAAIAPLLAGSARADVLLDQTKLIGLPTVAQTSGHSFTATPAEECLVTLTGVDVPAPFLSVQVSMSLVALFVDSSNNR